MLTLFKLYRFTETKVYGLMIFIRFEDESKGIATLIYLQQFMNKNNANISISQVVQLLTILRVSLLQLR